MNDYWFWLLLEANRWVVAGGLAFTVFAVFMIWGVSKPVSLQSAMEAGDMVETVFAGLVGAIITGTTLVVSINQLVLSQEIGSLGSQRNRMDVTMDYRKNTDDLLENAEHARDHLENGGFGTFDVISPALDYNYDRKMHDLRRLEREHDADLSDEERDALRDLLQALTMYGPVREIKDLYIQWALVKLSRAILYAAVVALLVAGGMVVFVDPTTFPGTFFGIERLLWVVSGAFAVSLLPFLLFTSYTLRLATLAKQTLSMGPLDLS